MKLHSVIAGAALSVFLACPLAGQEIKIGVLATLSGPAAVWGVSMQNAAEIAADEFNRGGGLNVGGKNYKVSVIAYDDRYKANEAVTAMRRLIYEDQVRIVVGPMGSAPAVAVLPMATENQVLTIEMAFTPNAIGKQFPYTFRPVLTTGEISDPQLRWVIAKTGAKKVGALFPNDESGQQVAIQVGKAYEKAGAQLVVNFFERDRVDFVPLLTGLVARNIDMIELDGNSPQTAGLMVKQARELGFKGAIVRTAGDATAEILSVAGKDAAEGIYLHQSNDFAAPQLKDYAERYKAKGRGPLNGFSPPFFANLQMLFAAMQRVGSASDIEGISQAMAQMSDFDTLLGKVSWTGSKSYGIDRQLSFPFYVTQVHDGVTKVVAHCTVEACI
jgi:branched-chain amino acid transport system substrate-binding protein